MTNKKPQEKVKTTKITKNNLFKKQNLIYVLVWFIIILSILFLLPLMKKTGNDCSKAIKTYLKSADMKWAWVEVKSWDSITVDYVWRFDDENVFDTSVESIAKACSKYTEWRDYDSWLPFTVWAGQMIAWFDKAVVGMKIWQTKTVTLKPEEAYWPRDEKQIVTIEKSKIPNADQYQEGMQVQTAYGQVLTVIKVTKNDITFDWNSEMVGKTLIFDITIKKIWK
jgi:peptidylprolyl isomerase